MCACRCTAPISPASPSGPFAGPMVVSMRPFKPADAIRAVQITSRFPAVHGAPVHLGHPHSIGIKDIAKPDYGDPVPVEARRDSGVLGLRRDPASGDRGGQAAVCDHACARIDAGDGSAGTSSWRCSNRHSGAMRSIEPGISNSGSVLSTIPNDVCYQSCPCSGSVSPNIFVRSATCAGVRITRVQPAQQQIELCGFFQFLDREYRGFQRIA